MVASATTFPTRVEMIGTVRSFETETRDAIWDDIRLIAGKTAEANHATAEVSFAQHNRVTRNDVPLTASARRWAVPTASRAWSSFRRPP